MKRKPSASSLIPLLTWDHTSDATSRINDITLSPWDQVYVRMEDRLASKKPRVHTDIKPIMQMNINLAQCL
jgi:hypothetical protein